MGIRKSPSIRSDAGAPTRISDRKRTQAALRRHRTVIMIRMILEVQRKSHAEARTPGYGLSRERGIRAARNRRRRAHWPSPSGSMRWAQDQARALDAKFGMRCRRAPRLPAEPAAIPPPRALRGSRYSCEARQGEEGLIACSAKDESELSTGVGALGSMADAVSECRSLSKRGCSRSSPAVTGAGRSARNGCTFQARLLAQRRIRM